MFAAMTAHEKVGFFRPVHHGFVDRKLALFREVFDLDDTVTQKDEAGEELSNQDEDDLENLPPDHDHSHLVAQADHKGDGDISLLKANITSLEVDLDTACNIVKVKEIELR